jgi:hypothetical protein
LVHLTHSKPSSCQTYQIKIKLNLSNPKAGFYQIKYNSKKGGLSMKTGSPRRLLMVITISLALVGAPEAFAQEGEDPEEPVQAMPKDGDVSAPPRKGAPPLKVKAAPSVKATPTEIPGKGQPGVKKKPSVQATPIEIPGKGTPVIKKGPSVTMTPEPVTGKGPPQVKPTGPRGTTPQSQSGKSGAEVTPRQ